MTAEDAEFAESDAAGPEKAKHRWWNVEAKNDEKNVKAEAEKESRLPIGKRISREAIAWFWVALAFMLINGTIGQARVIPSGSMENTLLIGDHLIMSRIGIDAGVPFTNWHVPLWRNPHRQDVIIFRPPYAPGSTDLIKRAIAVPGDTIDLHGGSVYVNGKKLYEPYAVGPTEPIPPGNAPAGFSELKFPYQVPDNCYVAMGDNRTNSYDSRFWGCVPRENIIGKPVMIYMSLDAPSDAWEPGEVRERFFAYVNAILHPGVVRWKRLFHTF